MVLLRFPLALLGSLLFALSITACSADARHQTPARVADSVGATTFVQPSRRDDHHAVCDSVATQWSEVAGVKVVRSDSTLTPHSSDRPVQACHVAMVAPGGLPEGAGAKSYWADSTYLATFRGWRMITRWEAEGPDGFSRTFVRAGVRCEIDFDQDGGDDSDSSYVPSPSVAERTTCWPDEGVTVRDTASYSVHAR